MITQKPKDLTIFEAAALPTVYLMVDYCFSPWIRPLTANDTVLIHTAAGGVGLIAIVYAQRAGARIIATAGSEIKRAYLKKLGITHVYDSRSLGFAKNILQVTNNQGVSVVLNTLTGEGFIEESLSVLEKNGTFIENLKA